MLITEFVQLLYLNYENYINMVIVFQVLPTPEFIPIKNPKLGKLTTFKHTKFLIDFPSLFSRVVTIYSFCIFDFYKDIIKNCKFK